MQRVGFRLSFICSGVLAFLVLAPTASANEVSTLPAAGELVLPSVAARRAPDVRARTVRVLRQFRSDFRPQIILAIAKRRVGAVAATSASATLLNVNGARALRVTARRAGTQGNNISVTVGDAGTEPTEDPQDVLTVAGLAFQYADADLDGLARAINAAATPVTAEVLARDAVLADGSAATAGGRDGDPGRLWYKLNLPVRPFGTTGWVPADSVDVRPTTRRIVVRRSARVLEVYRGARRIFRTRVAVGRSDRPTPIGNFYVAAKFRPPRTTLVSTYALELSAPAGLSDFPGGGVVGIHGTPAGWSIGKAASNGCVRVRPAAALALRRIVPLGTPVRVVR